jgi:EAL domain-containing protein (putative c-di-GMP-specific phosphodiesterase class I)
VLDMASQAAVRWQAIRPGLRVAVNLSARVFEQLDLPARVEGVLRRNGCRPGLLELEITEHVAMRDLDAGMATLRRLRDIGVGLALDDFGTGYSSLGWLRRLPVDRVKMDRAFVAEINPEQGGDEVTRSVIALVHALEREVVAEGVETMAQWQTLREMDCDLFQGFHLHHPLRAEDIDILITPVGRGASRPA